MIKINIICVGKLKEEYWRAAVSEYSKRLTAYCEFNIIELPEARLAGDPSQNQIADALEKEAELFNKAIGRTSGSRTIAMCIESPQLTSQQLASYIKESGVNGVSAINFLIGSSYGLADSLKSRCDLRISMSKMTFPHQLARVMLCEQIYRAFSINANSKYHK